MKYSDCVTPACVKIFESDLEAAEAWLNEKELKAVPE